MESETINLTNLICDALNTVFFKIFSSIDNTIYSTLDNILFIKTDIIDNSTFAKLFCNDSGNGFLALASSLILGILIFYILYFTVSHLIYSKVDSPYQFIFKCLIFIPCMCSSLWICKGIIGFVSIICEYIQEIGCSVVGSDTEINFSNLINNINLQLYPSLESFNIFSFDGIIKLCSTIVIIYILFTYSVRYIMIKVLVLLSPVAFVSLIFNRFDGFFKGWLKHLLCLLFMQVFVAIILVLGFCINFSPGDVLSQLLYFALILAIAKCHYNVKEIFTHIYEFSYDKLKDIL